ncbi:unnamed protein product [Mesocestoides corti]|uniref:Ribosome-recycling factor, mitochondrial n=1 Tax=Mesocestoides corti TaxID=53468 RepID=A0A3P6GVX9_MESCO|nr:unnamed protein product [Mesocestoides corti]
MTEELKQMIKDEEMQQEYARAAARFQDDIYRKLCLKLTPEHFYSIPIPGENVQLGEVASILSQTSAPSASAQPSTQVLIDLSGRPDLVPAAKTAVSQFLSSDSILPNPKQTKAASPASDLIEAVSQTQFTVRVRTIVTGDVRNELAKRGRDMLHRTKREMDKIYQKFSKPISKMKTLSEDDKHLANEYLKTIVKTYHTQVEKTWKAKEHELLNS